jgi:ABC-type xylose transport system permease subunit
MVLEDTSRKRACRVDERTAFIKMSKSENQKREQTYLQMEVSEKDMAPRTAGWIILVLAVLAVPHARGVLEYCGLILVSVLLIALNYATARKRKRHKAGTA